MNIALYCLESPAEMSYWRRTSEIVDIMSPLVVMKHLGQEVCLKMWLEIHEKKPWIKSNYKENVILTPNWSCIFRCTQLRTGEVNHVTQLKKNIQIIKSLKPINTVGLPWLQTRWRILLDKSSRCNLTCLPLVWQSHSWNEMNALCFSNESSY